MFIIYLKILPVGSICLIEYILIAVCCEALQIIMDLALFCTSRLMVFCVKLTYNSKFTVASKL